MYWICDKTSQTNSFIVTFVRWLGCLGVWALCWSFDINISDIVQHGKFDLSHFLYRTVIIVFSQYLLSTELFNSFCCQLLLFRILSSSRFTMMIIIIKIVLITSIFLVRIQTRYLVSLLNIFNGNINQIINIM